MSILIYTESQEGKFKKNAFELASYAKEVADKLSTDVVAIAINVDNAEELGKYGVSKVISTNVEIVTPQVVAALVSKHADGPIIFSHSSEGSSIAPLVAVKLDTSIITNVLEVPDSVNPIKLKRKTFSGKGIATVETSKENPVITLLVNSFGIKENQTDVVVEDVEAPSVECKVNVENIEINTDTIDLKEAERVVSGGRGLKGPENWGMIEELAKAINAATACSKPVSDLGWRPHSEHVGQTGKAISPDLYIAVGISGAIQHLAGVNSSKTIVVINNDPEAPFFKSADYGIVGDAFEVIPKLTQAIKNIKA